MPPAPAFTLPQFRLASPRALPRACVARDVHNRRQPANRASPSLSAAQIAHALQSAGALDARDLPAFQTLSPSRAALFARVLANRTRHLAVVLDGVWGAHNLAAVVRSCDAWGIQDLHVIAQPEEYVPQRFKRADDSVPAAASLVDRFDRQQSLKSVSKNSHKWLSVEEYDAVAPCLQQLKRAGYRVAVSSLSTSAVSIHDVDLSRKCAFVFGNEKFGVTAEMEAHADLLFTVPMFGFVESMNVSVAVGTTISLATTQCRQMLSADQFGLSADEKKSLAHTWLSNRLKKDAPPRLVSSPTDVTKLGYTCERKIVKDAMFTTVQHASAHNAHFWKTTLRLNADSSRLETYVKRRKIGALGDRQFSRRSATAQFFISGAHALSCEAAVHRNATLQVSRQTFVKYFSDVCTSINAHYSKYFDDLGVPTLPVFASESAEIMRRLERTSPMIAWRVCVQFAKDVVGMAEHDLAAIVRNADIACVARCISDTVRCDSQRAQQLVHIAKSCNTLAPRVVNVVRERDGARDVMPCVASDDWSHIESVQQRDLLQVCLRIMHAAFLAGEIHQTVWSRHVDSSVRRIHSLRFALLESVACDAFAEMALLDCSEDEALFRVLLEWDQTLAVLKSCARHE